MRNIKKNTKKGIPKKRLPQGLEGVVRSGKVLYINKDMISVEIRHHGGYIFKREDSRVFNEITGKDRKKVLCCFHGYGKILYYPYKVCNLENTKTFYQEK